MINTVEKIWGNSIAQICKEIAEENNLSFYLSGGWDPVEVTEEWYNSNAGLKFFPTPADKVIHGNEQPVPNPVDWATFKSRLDARYSQITYQRFRKAEYPPIEEYIDGIVKGDQDQIDAYVAKCAAVKAKYEKTMVHPGNQFLIDGQSKLA